MICRLFQLEKALPSTHTGVYQSAILAMLQQTTEREMEEIPDSILDDLPSSALQEAVENLCKLANDGLAEKKVVFKKSELRAAGCLGAAVELGFLSSTPSVSIAGHGEDAYSFQHHTMLEFFAAVHTVRDRIRKAKRDIFDLVSDRAWRRRRLCAILAIRKWPLVRRRVQTLAERSGVQR